MRGQASVEALLVLALVLTVSSGFIYIAQDSSAPINALLAARTGAENAINGMESKYEITIKEIERNGDNINIGINNQAEEIPEDSLKENIRIEALKFIHYTFKGSFPADVGSVETSHHTFDVDVTVNEVKK